MSWVLVVALLVIFVIRMGYSMVNRQRLRAQTGMTSTVQPVVGPAQRTAAEPMQTPESAPSWQPEEIAPVDPFPQQRGAVAAQTVPAPEPDLPPTPDDTSFDDTEVHGTLTLTPDLEAKVRELMDSGFEAGAVRLICDELGVGILAAQQTARAVAGLATP